MTPNALLVAGCLAMPLGWSLRGWQWSRRVRARIAASSRPEGGATDVGVPPATGIPPAAVVAGVAGTALAVLALGPVVLVLVVLGLAVTHVVARHRRRARALVARSGQLPPALERLAAALRSGSSLPVALDEAGRATPHPLGPELRALALGAGRGQSMAAVLDGWTLRHEDAGTRLASAALVLATVVGVTPARAVDGVAATLRERLELGAERRALASQARTSAIVLSAAPVVFAVLLGLGDGAAGRFLLHSQAGWACIGGGLGLDALGAWWMARLTRGEST